MLGMYRIRIFEIRPKPDVARYPPAYPVEPKPDSVITLNSDFKVA